MIKVRENIMKIKCIKSINGEYMGKQLEFFTEGKTYYTSSEYLLNISAIGNEDEEFIVAFLSEGGLESPDFKEHFIIEDDTKEGVQCLKCGYVITKKNIQEKESRDQKSILWECPSCGQFV